MKNLAALCKHAARQFFILHSSFNKFLLLVVLSLQGGEVPRGSSLSFFNLLIILFLSFARKKKYQGKRKVHLPNIQKM